MRFILAAISMIVPAVATAQAVVTERSISALAAQEAARVALEQCRKEGHRVAANFPASAGALNLEKIATAAGGLPIRAGNDIVGAIGVSGSRGSPNAPGGATDTKCAQAGIERIAAGLGG